jgi:hypothetical protein
MITITKVGSLVKIDGIEGHDNVYESISNFQGARMSTDGTQLSLQIGEVNIGFKDLSQFTIGGTVPTNAATVQTALQAVFPSAAPATALPTETVATYSAMQTSITSDPTTKRDFFVSADETNGGAAIKYSYNGSKAIQITNLVLNVRDFGAKGDGVTDDTLAIHVARDLGGEVFFPNGTYLTSGITANVSKQRWRLSDNAVLKAKSTSTAPVFTARAVGVTIKGGTIDGNRANVSSANVAGIYTYDKTATDLTIDGVTISNTLGYGVQSFGSRTKIRNCSLSNIGSVGILLNTSGANIYDCEVVNTLVDRSNENAATINTAGIQVRGDATYSASRAKVIGNTVLMPSNPSDAAGAPLCIEFGTNADYGVCANNTVNGGSMGVSISSADYVSVVCNTINSPSLAGIEIAGCNNTSISSNTIDGGNILGLAGSGSAGAIWVNNAALSNYITICNNNIRNLNSAMTNTINLTATGIGLTFGGNSIDAPKNALVSYMSNVSITGNSFFTGASGTRCFIFKQGSKVSITGNNISGSWDNLLEWNASTAIAFDSFSISGNIVAVTGNPFLSTLSGGATLGTVKVSSNVGISDYLDLSPGQAFISGYRYGNQTGASTSAPITQSTLMAFPFVVAKYSGQSFNEIGLEVTTAAASSVVRLGLYADTNGKPGTLITEYGTVDTSTTGYKTITISSTLLPGKYWIAAVAQGGAPTIGIVTGINPLIGQPDLSASGHMMTYTKTSVTGSLPSPFGSTSGLNFAPRVQLKAV